MTQERYLEEAGREQKGLPIGDEAKTTTDGPPGVDEQREPADIAAREAERGPAHRRRPTGADVQLEVQR